MQFTASGTIIRSRFVKPSGNSTVAQQNTAGAIVCGISQDAGRVAPIPANTADPPEAARSGESLRVHSEYTGGNFPTLEIGSGGCTVGNPLKSDANGKGVVCSTTGHYVGAIAMETAAEGELCKVRPCLFVFAAAS